MLLPACGPSEERASEIQLHEAIDRLRSDAPNGPERRLKLVAVENAPALTPTARAAKDACLPAYRDLLDAEDAISLAEQRVKQAEILKLLPADALTELAAAEILLRKAREQMPACDAAAARLAVSAR